ncbi:hypothetical protein EDC01DRAFT_675252 [Geopyxis carbonaria]|nr:hypothetical protein EDC01DRAFT_675252 [Geopyxis carbonaria]
MKYFLSKTKLLKTVHVEWINQELDEAVYDNYLNYEQKMRISWVYGRINKRIPGFASNEDIISDYGALPPGSKVDIPSFVIHVIDQGSYALVHRAYTQKWEQNVQGALKMVILIEWAYLHKKLLQGQLEVLEYDKLKGCLVSKQRETLLPWQVNRWPVIYVKQSILLGDHVPNPDREIGLKVGYLVDDAIEHISSEGLGCAAGYCKPSCNHEPIAESELGDLADHDINADHLALDTALRTAVAAAPVSSIISNANNQSNSNNITDSHDTTTINITFQTINPREYDTPKTPAEFLTFFNNTIEDLKVRGATNTAEIVKLANLCAEKIGSACAILGLPQAKATNDLATVSLYTSIVFCGMTHLPL